MRKKTVRSGLRLITAGMLCLLAGTFFPVDLAGLFLLGFGGEARVILLGFILGWVLGGCGVLLASAGLVLQGGIDESRLRLTPSIMLLISVIVLFFFLAFGSFTPHQTPQLPSGESITI
jgi:hypothetical protein